MVMYCLAYMWAFNLKTSVVFSSGGTSVHNSLNRRRNSLWYMVRPRGFCDGWETEAEEEAEGSDEAMVHKDEK